jgi:hypothetical protein
MRPFDDDHRRLAEAGAEPIDWRERAWLITIGHRGSASFRYAGERMTVAVTTDRKLSSRSQQPPRSLKRSAPGWSGASDAVWKIAGEPRLRLITYARGYTTGRLEKP